MIVFIDVKSNMIQLYSEKGIKSIPFNQVDTLKYHTAGVNNILYITQAIDASVQDVISLVKAQSGQTDSPQAKIDTKNDPLHVRFTGKGVLNITDLGVTTKDGVLEPETFRGPVDFKLLSHLEKKGFNESGQVQALLKAGKLEVLPLSMCQSIRLEYENKNNADEELDQITIPKGMTLNEYLDKIESGEISEGGTGNDAIEIDIMSSKGGGADSNEGCLLPADFMG